MRKKLVCGAMCVALSAMLVGCGKDTVGSGDTQSTKEQSTVQETESSDENATEEKNIVSDDSTGAWVLRKEVTDKAVLDEPSGAALFPDKLTLPINIDSLMDYQVLAGGVDQGTLSSIVDSYTDSFTSLDFMILDKTGTIYSYMPDLLLGKEDDSNETNIKQAISDGNWMLGPSAMYYDTLGLTEDEYKIMKQHVNLGYEKLKNQNIDMRIKEACLLHHEKCDGTGYPFGLKSESIPVSAKIIAIADVYDAMTAARVYRGALCPFEVIETMHCDAFTKFDPKYILPFLKNVASSYIHNDVRLSDGRTGKVILINDNALSQPVVQCGDTFVDLSKEHGLKVSSIL